MTKLYKMDKEEKLKLSKEEKLDKERKRLSSMSFFENKYNKKIVAGVDEAGRGPLAGCVVAACVVLDPESEILYLNDSKKLSEKRRNELFVEIKEKAISYGIGIVSESIIDKINILNASKRAMILAYEKCLKNIEQKYNKKIDVLLIDALKLDIDDVLQEDIIKGDAKSISIAAASILAKVTRDNICYKEYDVKYPNYGFAKHKGYGTKEHLENIKKYGPSPIHRKSFLH